MAVKPVNVIAFTPGTSFSSGWATGHAEERALLYIMLAEAIQLGWQQKNYAITLLQATATRKGFERAIADTRRALGGPPDEGISTAFWSEVQRRGLDVRFLDLLQLLIDELANDVSNALWPEVRRLISDLRQCLARASVERLEPDLVIFDEFQRFRHLMDPEQGGESAELAEALYDHRDARLLLLSATPYKPFTSVEESSAGEDHYKDFRQTLGFLAQDEDWDRDVDHALADYRRSLLTGDDADAPPARERVRRLLLQVMSRTERPTLGEVGEADTGAPRHDGMLSEHMAAADDLLPDDLVSYVAMRQLATTIDAHMSLDYWKSAPYFLNFAESYQIGQRIKERLEQRDLGELLSGLSLIDRHAVGRFDDIGLGNARLRAVAAQTVDAGWWKLLWMPPSMPYVQLEEPFAALRESGITKRLVFSGWNATPAAVASLISYEVDRHLMGGRGLENDPVAIRNATRRLALRFDQPPAQPDGDRVVLAAAGAGRALRPARLGAIQPAAPLEHRGDRVRRVNDRREGRGKRWRGGCIGSRARPALATPAAARRRQPPWRRRFRGRRHRPPGLGPSYGGDAPARTTAGVCGGRGARKSRPSGPGALRPGQRCLAGGRADSLARATPSPWKADGELR